MGERPFTYRPDKKTKHFSEEAVVRTYALYGPDSFEHEDAYSLHADLRAAKKFKPPYHTWQDAGESEIVYVSKRVLDEINKKKGKSIFV